MAWRSGQTALVQSPLTRAVMFSAMTTATGFGSLWLSNDPGTSSMGRLMALALISTMAAAVFFQPALMGPPRSRLARAEPTFAPAPQDLVPSRRPEARAFAIPGRRLVYSVGILWLAATAGLLLTIFGGITDRLIPLFAVGAFMAFTLSQLGMAFHWARQHGNRVRLWINGTGAAGTGLALAIILSAKFIEGAWITVVVIPLVLGMLKAIKRHYELIDRQLREEGPIDLRGLQPPIVVIPVERWDRLAEKAVRFALLLSREVIAIHLTKLEGPDAEEHEDELRRQWHDDVELPARSAGLTPPKLVISASPYRSFVGRLLKHVATIEAQHPDRPLAVVVPEVVEEHWWDYLLLNNFRTRRLYAALMRHGGSNLAIVLVPWAYEPPHPEGVIEEEEPGSQEPAVAAPQGVLI
jgi:hypothetical protein